MKKPANIQKTALKITLKTYVLILERISDGNVKNIRELNGVENRVARELVRSGLASEKLSAGVHEGQIYAAPLLAITPEGISSLGAWSEQLKSQSLLYKIGDNLLRVLWLVTGVMIASISNLLK